MNPIEMFQQLPPEQQQELVKQGVKGADKLFDGIKKVLGYFFEPKHIKKMAEAEAYKVKALADAKATGKKRAKYRKRNWKGSIGIRR